MSNITESMKNWLKRVREDGPGDRTEKSRYEISEDELMARMEVKSLTRDEPLTKAVAILEQALDKVMTDLGVDCTVSPEEIHQRQEDLGIIIVPEDRPEMAGLNGYFIFLDRYGDFVPHSWIGAVRMMSDGKCYCDIHYFHDERLEVVGGIDIFDAARRKGLI